MKNETYDNLIPNKVTRFWTLALFVAAFSVESIFYYVLILLNKMPVISDLSFLFMPVVFGALIYFNYSGWICYKIKNADIIYVMAYLLIMGGSYLLFPDNRIYLEAQWELIFVTVPMYYFLGLIFTSDKKTIEILALLAKLIIVVDIVFVIYWQGVGNEMGSDAMGRAYSIMPSVLFLIMCAFNRGKFLDWAWMIFAVIYQFTFGTRGPVIIDLTYILYFMLFKGKGLTLKKCISIIVFVAFVIFYNTSAFEDMIISLGDWFEEMGLSNRVFSHMLEDTLISDDSGRSVIREKVYEMILENPFGNGVGAEHTRNFLVHQFFLQIFLHFGIVGGIVIIGAVIVLIVRALKKNINPIMQDFLVMWACALFVRSFVGASYLSYYFPFLIGICIQTIRSKKTNDNSKGDVCL